MMTDRVDHRRGRVVAVGDAGIEFVERRSLSHIQGDAPGHVLAAVDQGDPAAGLRLRKELRGGLTDPTRTNDRNPLRVVCPVCSVTGVRRVAMQRMADKPAEREVQSGG